MLFRKKQPENEEAPLDSDAGLDILVENARLKYNRGEISLADLRETARWAQQMRERIPRVPPDNTA